MTQRYPRHFTDLNELVFWDKNNKRLGRNSAILSSDLHQIWRLFTKLYSAVYLSAPCNFNAGQVPVLRCQIEDEAECGKDKKAVL